MQSPERTYTPADVANALVADDRVQDSTLEPGANIRVAFLDAHGDTIWRTGVVQCVHPDLTPTHYTIKYEDGTTIVGPLAGVEWHHPHRPYRKRRGDDVGLQERRWSGRATTPPARLIVRHDSKSYDAPDGSAASPKPDGSETGPRVKLTCKPDHKRATGGELLECAKQKLAQELATKTSLLAAFEEQCDSLRAALQELERKRDALAAKVRDDRRRFDTIAKCC